ncbi:hypothetical protein C1645_781738 [Glomus cerebriforme]|uniref:Uncharacterized protein n=1 Tax=Glomus cerebriforme TaxID=658196 RepID=A0A397SLI8_9GLOM|nr:hypothetical protein C1645_781738 [Glomus cerebriforme]
MTSPPELNDNPDELNFASFKQIYRRPFDNKVFVDKNIPLTWNQHIRGLFTWNNAQCMTIYLNLTSYSNITTGNLDNIMTMLSEKKMPPGEPWPDEWIDLFKRWVDTKKIPENKGNPSRGEDIDPNNYDSLIMDLPIQYTKFSDVTTFNEDISRLFSFCDQKMGVRDYNVAVKNYEQFKNAAIEYGSLGENKENKKNIVFDIFHDQFPQGNPWPQLYKDALNNWIGNEYQEGEQSIYDTQA